MSCVSLSAKQSSRAWRAGFCLALMIPVGGCSDRSSDSSPSRAGAESPAGDEMFVDAAAESGIDFVHFNGMSGELYFVEMNGPGCGLLDYDNDGDLDVYLVQGGPLGEAAGERPGDRLFRNDLAVAADDLETRVQEAITASFRSSYLLAAAMALMALVPLGVGGRRRQGLDAMRRDMAGAIIAIGSCASWGGLPAGCSADAVPITPPPGSGST